MASALSGGGCSRQQNTSGDGGGGGGHAVAQGSPPLRTSLWRGDAGLWLPDLCRAPVRGKQCESVA